jgi:hypothetical protein
VGALSNFFKKLLTPGIVLLEGNLLGARETTGEKLAGGDRARIGVLSGSGKSLHRAQDLGHALGVIGEKHRNLGADDGLGRASAGGPLLTGDGPTASLQHKLVQVLASHELHHLGTESLLPSPKVLRLGRKCTEFIV